MTLTSFFLIPNCLSKWQPGWIHEKQSITEVLFQEVNEYLNKCWNRYKKNVDIAQENDTDFNDRLRCGRPAAFVNDQTKNPHSLIIGDRNILLKLR